MFALAAVAAAVASIAAPAPVTALAADGDRIAYASGRSPSPDCDRIRVAHRRTGKVLAKLGRAWPCVGTSTGTGIAQMAIAGRRVLWLHYTGGNIREWSLYTGHTRAPTPRRIGFWAQDVDLPAPVVIGEGDVSRPGNQLPYAIGREVRVLSESGARQATWTEPSRVVGLAAGSGAVIVATADGRVAVREQVDWSREIDSWSGRPAATAVFLADEGVVAQRGRTLELRVAGRAQRALTLPAGARVTDAAFGRVVYLVGGRARLLHLLSGRTADLGPASFANAELLTAITARDRMVRVVPYP